MNGSADDHAHMARAIRLASRGLYTADPNPRVGCVITQNGDVVGMGWHARAGEAHAEIRALEAAGSAARGATAYVTLEPCCHHGRTPPCTDALLAAGIVRVVIATPDPNPAVAGAGQRQLQDAGVEVTSGVKPGERVVTRGQHFLADGYELKILPPRESLRPAPRGNSD